MVAGRLALGAALVLAGCATRPMLPYTETTPPLVRVSLGDARIRDLRTEYRAALCPRLQAGDGACDDVLLRFGGEAQQATPPERSGASSADRDYRLVFVPGLFAECIDRYVRPFSDVVEAMSRDGHDVHYFAVAGRGSSAENAKALAAQFAALPDDGRSVIAFGYSKGLPDLLEMVVRYPESVPRLAAIVGFAGAFGGTPLAEGYAGLYRHALAQFPFSDCATGTGAELADLRRDVRQEWWRRHREQIAVPLFAIAGAPRPERVSPILEYPHARLSAVDPHNDGQLLWQDAIAPGATLLGYVNADHWGIAMPLSRQFPLFAHLFIDDVPRAALVAAAVQVVTRTLHAPAPLARATR